MEKCEEQLYLNATIIAYITSQQLVSTLYLPQWRMLRVLVAPSDPYGNSFQNKALWHNTIVEEMQTPTETCLKKNRET